jgi:hypothetical protein
VQAFTQRLPAAERGMLLQGDTGAMEVLELYRWRVTDPVSGRRYITRYPMSEVNAKHLDPQAERIDDSLQRMAVRKPVPQPRPHGRHVARP